MFDRLSGVKLDTTFVIEIGRIISNLATSSGSGLPIIILLCLRGNGLFLNILKLKA